MSEILENSQTKTIGKSWVIQLPQDFIDENSLPMGTEVLLTFRDEKLEAEILPPLTEKLSQVANQILKKRAKVFEELKQIGD